ncbi:MAG: PspC domain-containing protein [Micrococcales bacterium]|nr:PspC domain-containing protein [Micrococcales bacterium]
MNSIHSAMAREGFTRSTDDRVLAGVCGGLARKFGINAWAMRALIIATMFLLPGSQIIVYPIAWVLMPDDTAAVEGAGPQDRLMQ